MKKMATLGAATLLSIASIGAHAQVQTLNDVALSKISGQGLYKNLVQGTKPFAKGAAVDVAVGTGAVAGTVAVTTSAVLLNIPAAAITWVAGPVIATASMVAIIPAQIAIAAATPVVATGALIKGRKVNGPDGTGIRHAAEAIVAGTAGVVAAPIVGVGIAATALAANGPAAATVLLAGPVVAVSALSVGTATAAVAGVSFVHNSAHVVGRIPYNGVQVVKSHIRR